jgi:hypothetical protein
LLRLAQRQQADYATIRDATETLWSAGETLCYTPQKLGEFWNVCTRPVATNGFGLTATEANSNAIAIESAFTLLRYNEHVHEEWRKVVLNYSVIGVRVHDARLGRGNARPQRYASVELERTGFCTVRGHHRSFTQATSSNSS